MADFLAGAAIPIVLGAPLLAMRLLARKWDRQNAEATANLDAWREMAQRMDAEHGR